MDFQPIRWTPGNHPYFYPAVFTQVAADPWPDSPVIFDSNCNKKTTDYRHGSPANNIINNNRTVKIIGTVFRPIYKSDTPVSGDNKAISKPDKLRSAFEDCKI